MMRTSLVTIEKNKIGGMTTQNELFIPIERIADLDEVMASIGTLEEQFKRRLMIDRTLNRRLVSFQDNRTLPAY